MFKFPPKINVSPDTVINGVSNEVALSIEGTPFRYWTQAEITRSFDTIADTFTISTPFQSDNKKFRDIFKPFKYRPCAVYIGGEKILTGEILNIETDVTNNAHVLKVDGYSKAGRLADCCVPPANWPISIDGLNLRGIATRLAKIYNIDVVFDGKPGAIFERRDRIEINPTDYIYDVLIELAKLRGFVISSDKDGNLWFRKTPKTPATVNIKAGKNPFVNGRVSYSGQARYSDVTVMKQEMAFGPGKKITVKDKEIEAFRAVVVQAEDTEAGSLKNVANTRLNRLKADSISGTITLTGWRRYDNNAVWADGDKLNFESAGNMVYKTTEFMVREAKLVKTDNALSTQLNIVLPESFT